MNFKVVCKSTEERNKEIQALFEKMKPLLIEGKTYNQALRIVKNNKSTYSTRSWYKDLVEYGESQGFPKEEFDYGNKYGFLNVQLLKNSNSLTGYYWVYRYYTIKGENKSVSSDDIRVLEQRVKNKGLQWKLTNRYKAEKTYQLNKELQRNKRPSKTTTKGKKSSSGVKYVSKLNHKKAKKGFYWMYKNGVTVQATTLLALKQRVDERGLAWEIVDTELYEENLIKEGS